MRKSIAAAAALATGAFLSGLGAADSVPTKWFGSDSLAHVTSAAITGTVGASQVNNYLGGGSGTGVSAMANKVAASAIEQAAPSTKMLTGGACAYNLASGNNGAFTTNAEGIVIGLDTVDIMGSIAALGEGQASNQCTSPGTVTTVTSDGLASGNNQPSIFGASGNASAGAAQNWKYILALVYGGLDLTTGVTDCNQLSRKNLVASWSNLFQNACTNNVAICNAADATHNGGQLVHAFRRDDSSATADVFSALLGLQAAYPSPSASANNGFGTSPYCNSLNWDTSAANKTASCNGALGAHDNFVGPGGIPDPLSTCVFNDFSTSGLASSDTNAQCTLVTGMPSTCTTPPCGGNHRMPPPNTLGSIGRPNGSLAYDALPTSFQDNDPIRRKCFGSGNVKTWADASGGSSGIAADAVCNIDGNLGLVLAIPSSEFIPNSLGLQQYPTNKCTTYALGDAFKWFNCAPTGTGSHAGQCPNGDFAQGANQCVIPVDSTVTPNTSQCISGSGPQTTLLNPANVCQAGQDCTTVGAVIYTSDARSYNLAMRDGTSAFIKQTIQNGGAGIALQFYGGVGRIHSVNTIWSGSSPPNAGCQLLSVGDQVGCLVQADPCSLGFEADGGKGWTARANGNACTNLTNFGICPGANCPAACTGGSVTDSIRVAGTYASQATATALGQTNPPATGVYQLARKLYYNSIIGFGFINAPTAGDTGVNGELDVASWEASQLNEQAVLPLDGFFPLANQATAAFNAPFCEDFNELLVCGASAGSNAQNGCFTLRPGSGAPNSGASGVLPANASSFTPNAGVALPFDTNQGVSATDARGAPSTSTICGDGIVEAYEECDPGATATGSTSTCSNLCRCPGKTSWKQTGGTGPFSCQ